LINKSLNIKVLPLETSQSVLFEIIKNNNSILLDEYLRENGIQAIEE